MTRINRDLIRHLEFDPERKPSKIYPTVKDYAVARDHYLAHLHSVNPDHVQEVERTLIHIDEVRDLLKRNEPSSISEFENLGIVAVGSSVARHDYRDIDVVVVGFQTPGISKAFQFDMANKRRQTRADRRPLSFTSMTYTGFPVASLQDDSSIVHFLVDESRLSFYDWHKNMVDRNQQYALLGGNHG